MTPCVPFAKNFFQHLSLSICHTQNCCFSFLQISPRYANEIPGESQFGISCDHTIKDENLEMRKEY